MDGYPEDGNIATTLEWVDGDPQRAAYAQGIEQLKTDGGRKSLLNTLEQILVGEGPAAADAVESSTQPQVKRTRISRVGTPYTEIRH